MSRSNPTISNPAVKFFRWAGGNGELVHYDKEQEKEIVEKLPFEFLVLDQLATIAGFSDEDQSGFWSNEVRNTKTDELTVRTSKGTKFTGLYADLMGDRNCTGAKYAKSVYIAYKDGGAYTIGNFKIYGAALTSWIDFCKSKNVLKCGVSLTGKGDVQTKGKTEYYLPVFDATQPKPEDDSAANLLDQELQIYLHQYFASKRVDDEVATSRSDEPPVSAYEDLANEVIEEPSFY